MTTRTGAAEDEDWWCWECHGLGSWYEDEQETDDPGDVECPCCCGDGCHAGDEPPPCAPRKARGGPPTPTPPTKGTTT